MNLSKVVIASSFALVAACSTAQKSTEVTPAFISSTKYSGVSCNNLRSESERLRSSVSNLEAGVDKAYSDDKTMEVVAWVLFWPAALAMDGNDAEAKQLAEAKGEAEAIRAEMLRKGCRL